MDARTGDHPKLMKKRPGRGEGKHMADVSLIVPVYQAARFLRGAVRSMRAQTHADIEILLVDDGSTDGGGALCDEMAREDARIRVIHQGNAGSGAARNAGLYAARGEYVYFCDADDRLDARLVEDCLAAARLYDADIVEFGYETVRLDDGGEEGAPARELPGLCGVYDREAFWKHFREERAFMCSLWTRMFRRAFLRENNLRFGTLSTGQDAVFLFDVYEAPFRRIVCQRRAYYTYVRHGRSATAVYGPERMENELAVAWRFEALIRQCPYARGRYDDLVGRQYFLAANRAVKARLACKDAPLFRRIGEARRYLGQPEFERAFARARAADWPRDARRAALRLLRKRMYGTFALAVYMRMVMGGGL